MISEALFLLAVGVNVGFHVRATIRALRNRATPVAAPAVYPPLTILKPCESSGPGLADNLRSFTFQDYPAQLQIIGCLPSSSDPAADVFNALARDNASGVTVEAVYSDGRPDAMNRKVKHLEAGLDAARNETLVFSDDDIRLEPGQLRELVACLLASPDIGVAFAAPAIRGGGAGTRWIHHWLCAAPTSLYLLATVSPGGPVSNGGCLVIRKSTLEALGGLEPLRDHVGDDLGMAVGLRRLGLRTVMAPTPAVSEMPELTRGQAWRMMHRWMVVLTSYFPDRLWAYPVILCSLPLLGLWAVLELRIGFSWYVGAWAVVWLARIVTGRLLAGRVFREPYPLRYATGLPFAELVYLAAWGWAFLDRRIIWRGRRFRVGRRGTMTPLM